MTKHHFRSWKGSGVPDPVFMMPLGAVTVRLVEVS